MNGYLNIKPLKNQTDSHDLNTGLVCYSDPNRTFDDRQKKISLISENFPQKMICSSMNTFSKFDKIARRDKSITGRGDYDMASQ